MSKRETKKRREKIRKADEAAKWWQRSNKRRKSKGKERKTNLYGIKQAIKPLVTISKPSYLCFPANFLLPDLA